MFDAWHCCPTPPAAVTSPGELRAPAAAWMPAEAPGTVAAVLTRHGQWSLDSDRDLDAEDWWYRTQFEFDARRDGDLQFLCFDGLATRADVWLNDRRVLVADNMFRPYRVDVTDQLQSANELFIAFRSLTHDLNASRARPRWKTSLVSHQQLRWHRTTLLGRMPGWSPSGPPIGPWRAVRLETGAVILSELRLRSEREGDTGVVRLEARIDAREPIAQATLVVGGRSCSVTVTRTGNQSVLFAEHRIPNPDRWWPHTHGPQPTVECVLLVVSGGMELSIPCGNIGFRTVERVPGGGFGVRVNGEDIYCRGACWTISDLITGGGTDSSVRCDLEMARDAGINMLRVGGTTAYESDAFYDLCDELGILVWQDFMFANMDYPFDDPTFLVNAESEVGHHLGRLARHPCVVVYCGNSEIEQQVAMLGLPPDVGQSPWFTRRLPELCGERHPGTLYVPSAPSGGALPFHVRTGVSNYYGVGAYKRSPRDLRKDDVKFASECLGFANVPDPATLGLLGAGASVPHHPKWKRGVPRDAGAGWDFDDIRDHYLRHLYRVDPVELRSVDTPRYLQLSRLVSGEMMAQTFSEWRSPHSNNRGGLVWFYKDLRPGAGWGIVDGTGRPKAAYYYLRRTWGTRQLLMTDEGLDGLHLHVINETKDPLRGFLELTLLKDQHTVVARQETAVALSPRATMTIGSDDLLGRFCDVTYAYRFGPPAHDLAVATLFDADREVVSEAVYFVAGRELPPMLPAANLEVAADRDRDGLCRVTLLSDRFLHGVTLHAPGFLPVDNYFHLPPGRKKVVPFRAVADAPRRFKATIEALNLPNAESVRLDD